MASSEIPEEGANLRSSGEEETVEGNRQNSLKQWVKVFIQAFLPLTISY